MEVLISAFYGIFYRFHLTVAAARGAKLRILHPKALSTRIRFLFENSASTRCVFESFLPVHSKTQ